MKERKIVKLDRAERLMEEAGIPKPVALQAGDTVL